MNFWRYILSSRRYYRRIHLAVAVGTAVTTAVVVGALLVGDSMRGSLQRLALGSLGQIDAVIVAEHPFRQRDLHNGDDGLTGAGLLLTQGSASFRTDNRAGEGVVRRAAQLQVIGFSPEFWSLATPSMAPPAERGNQIALTETAAKELGVEPGDAVLLRVPLAGSIPADSTLGEKEETVATRRLTVTAVLPDDADAGLTRFSLRPSQTPPRNAFVPLTTLQDMLDLSGKVNALVLAGPGADDESTALATVEPALDDFGVTVKPIALGEDGTRRYLQISADRLVLSPPLVAAAQSLYGDDDLQPVVVYLANRMVAGDKQVPYSTVAGVDSTRALGPVVDEAGAPIALADDEVALNDWTARELGAAVGDAITFHWYEPETTHGALREHAPLTLRVKAILPLAGAEGVPTAAADPHFAPELPGVTDQESIDAWELPFALVEEIRDADEQYWDERRTTPKAFVSHALAARLWGTRWGTDSVLRLPLAEGRTAASAAAALAKQIDPAEMGMSLLPLRENALAAASGTTPFDGLFLGFSFFLMTSAVLLTALLFRLGIEQRAREIGLLMALGVPLRRLRRLLLVEGGLAAAAGGAAGTLVGVGYAWLMAYGLNTWWIDATAEPFVRLHVTPRSLVIGFVSGLLAATAAMVWSIRRLARLPARQLLAGDVQPPLLTPRANRFSRTILPAMAIVAACGLAAAGRRLQGEAQAGAFFGSGALALAGILMLIRGKLREAVVSRPRKLGLTGLAVRNARRHPSRTMLTLGLAATASFLIVAVSAFRLAPTEHGVGGFELLAMSDLPVLFDLNSPAGRRELGFSEDDQRRLEQATVVGFRVRDGQDASCLNLYKPTEPRILGAPPTLAQASDFAWADALENPPPSKGGARERIPIISQPVLSSPVGGPLARTFPTGGRSFSPWELLTAELGDDAHGRPIVPMILDRNTAFYSLQLYGVGQRLVIRDGAGRPTTLQIVALLANSALQGDIVISERNFLRLFPETAGTRFFLIRAGDGESAASTASLLETELEDYGFDAVDARQRLGELLAVQNTYLSTFQTLGALGLLLGAAGLAVAQLRSALERRGELALMQAAGFSRRRLARMTLAENLALLFGGLGIGALAALTAVLPHAVAQQAVPPWGTLATLLAVIGFTGWLAAWLAARTVLQEPLLPALRGE